MDKRTDVSKFPPVFYRTSVLWGRCPALTLSLHWITSSRASYTAAVSYTHLTLPTILLV